MHNKPKFTINEYILFQGEKYYISDIQHNPHMGYRYYLEGLNQWVAQNFLITIK